MAWVHIFPRIKIKNQTRQTEAQNYDALVPRVVALKMPTAVSCGLQGSCQSLLTVRECLIANIARNSIKF